MRKASLFGFAFATLVTHAALAAEPSNPLVSSNPVQQNGDFERFPIAVHVPIALGWAAPYGAIDGHPGGGMSANAGTFTNFELGVGLRVRRLVVDFLTFSIGGAGLQNGAIKGAIDSLGYESHGPLRIFLGSDVAYYIARPQNWAPWVGLRLGYEALSFSGSAGDRSHLSYSFGGIYTALRAGVDWRIAPAFGLGPVLELGWGRFLNGSADASVDDDPLTLENESRSSSEALDLAGGGNHGYVGSGVRVVFFP